MIRLPKCVLFDLDGTILDSLPGIESSVRVAFTDCDLPVPAASLREMIGPPIRAILARAGNIHNEKILDALELAFRKDYDSNGWQKTICFPDVAHVLQKMSEGGYRLFVISNKPYKISLRILEKEGILNFFEAILTRDSRHPSYEGKAEMAKTLLAERNLVTQECLIVGDTIEDAKAARAVGISFIYMTHGYGIVDTASMLDMYRFDNFSQFMPLIAKELAGD